MRAVGIKLAASLIDVSVGLWSNMNWESAISREILASLLVKQYSQRRGTDCIQWHHMYNIYMYLWPVLRDFLLKDTTTLCAVRIPGPFPDWDITEGVILCIDVEKTLLNLFHQLEASQGFCGALNAQQPQWVLAPFHCKSILVYLLDSHSEPYPQLLAVNSLRHRKCSLWAFTPVLVCSVIMAGDSWALKDKLWCVNATICMQVRSETYTMQNPC